jgi:hypothetical protein
VYPGRINSRPALSLAILAVADNPRRLLQFNDDSSVASLALSISSYARQDSQSDSELLPFSLALGIEGQSLPQRLRISSTLEREELHLHTDQVIKDRMI